MSPGRAGTAPARATLAGDQEPWYEQDTGRLEILNRVRLWRYLLGDERADVDYWLTRIENEPQA